MLAALINVTESLGYPALFLFVMAESLGVPVPGETALILGALAAARGDLSIVAVIVVSAAAAIIGDNIGFVIGQRGGRTLLERPGRFAAERGRALAIGDPFFERHGTKAVFLGRWITILRTWASWLAGASVMRWRTFLIWNAAGGIAWSVSIGLAAYYGGKSVEHVITEIGIYGASLLGLALVAIVATVLVRRRRH